MNRQTAFATPFVSFALFSLLSLGSPAPALAAPVTDTFPLTLTGKEWCRDDPKFVDTVKVKAKEGVTVALTHDPLTTDVQATINTHGLNATIDAITLKGRALFANKSHSIAQLVLSGRDPGNADHFMTLRGQATFDKTGKLTKVTGTFVYQILSESGGVQDVDCFGSGTFGTQKLPSPSSGNGGGTLTVANAPASVGSTFKVVPSLTATGASGNIAGVKWVEVSLANPTRLESLDLLFDNTTNELHSVIFAYAESGQSVATGWSCSGPGFFPGVNPDCTGVIFNRVTGTASFTNTVLTDLASSPLAPITLNGTLTFTPF